MEELDWSQILGGLAGGQGPGSLPLNPELLPPPPVETGGPGTGPGTMGRPLLTPPAPLPPALPPAPLTSNEGTTPPMSLSPPGVGMRQGRQGETDMDLGAALTGNVPLPQGRPTDVGAQGRSAAGGGGAEGPITLGGPGGHTPFGGAAAGTPADQAKKAAGIAAALKGVQAPAAPAAQKVATPNAPRPTGTIKGGDLQALLMALNAAPGAGGIKLPTTLGQSVGR